MRMSDWSSVVCSSDLTALARTDDLGDDRHGLAQRERGDGGGLTARGVTTRVVGEQVADGAHAESTLEGGGGLAPHGAVQARGERQAGHDPSLSNRADAAGGRAAL